MANGITQPNLSQQVLRHIFKQIQDGTLKTGDKLPTNRGLAEELGVSILTVQRSMKQLEAQGTVTCHRRTGTFLTNPDSINSPKIQSGLIGLFVPEFLADFQTDLMIELEQGLMEQGKLLSINFTHSEPEREINLLEAIGAWAGTAIENARLHRQARRLAVLEERERIGMDLHDGIIQSIYGVGLALEYARMAVDEDPDMTREKISQSIDGLNEAIRDLRAYILDLNPRQLQREETLKQGLQRLLDEFRANTLAEANLVTSEDGLVEMPDEHALAMFHICQEALANVAKHAQAHKAEVHLWTTEERVLLEITDNGRGFDVRMKNATLGHGLSNMVRRARKVGGDVEISSHPMGGTTVLAWVPWEQNGVPLNQSNEALSG